MTDDQILEVVQAHKEGKRIQVLAIHSDLGWQDCDNPSWDFRTTHYRVAPEPRKPREWVLAVVKTSGDIAGKTVNAKDVSDIETVRVREVIE